MLLPYVKKYIYIYTYLRVHGIIWFCGLELANAEYLLVSIFDLLDLFRRYHPAIANSSRVLFASIVMENKI